MKHRKDILQQVNEKERSRIQERKSKYQEAEAIRAETELRNRYIKDTLKSKMKGLRYVFSSFTNSLYFIYFFLFQS